MLTPEHLSKNIAYDPDTGELIWIARENPSRGWNKKYAGKPALSAINSEGYRNGYFQHSSLKAHRVAWAIYYGEWPNGQIDHINGIRSDNRIVNLRDVSPRDNTMNQKVRSDSRSGITGVSRSHGQWKARIGQMHLGTFATKELAQVARKAADAEHGFHANHGRKRQ